MNEPPALLPPESQAEPIHPPPEPVAKRDLMPWLYGAGFLVLAVALLWVWRHPAVPPEPRLDELVRQLSALETRVARLEQQPKPQIPDLRQLEARVKALEERPSPASPPATDLGPLTDRVTALEQRPAGSSPAAGPAPTVDLKPLETRIAALETKQSAESQLAARVDTLSAHADTLSATIRSLQSDVTSKLDAEDARLATVERNSAQIAALADRTTRIARVQAAQAALEAGQKLGALPNAPPELARFANVNPPTEADLRLAFPAAARAALAAAKPSVQGQPLLDRLWVSAQELVTIRRGDRVLVGDPAAGLLERARTLLNAGDLNGAVDAVASLTGPSAEAMAGWLAEARALLDARSALIEWAAHA